MLDQSGKTCAEIYSVLHAVQNNISLTSSNDNSSSKRQLYQEMFPDSESAKSYEIGRTKLGYVVNFGL